MAEIENHSSGNSPTLAPHGEASSTRELPPLLPVALLFLATIIIYGYGLTERGWWRDDFGFHKNAASMSFFESFTIFPQRPLIGLLYHFVLCASPLRAHAFSLIIHLINIYLLYRLATALLGKPGGWAAAMAFSLHPQSSISIQWGCTNIFLVSAFAFLAAAHAARYDGKKVWLVRTGGFICILAGLLVVEQGIFVTPLFALLAVAPNSLKKPGNWATAVFFGLASVICVLLKFLLATSGKHTWLTLQGAAGRAVILFEMAFKRSVSPGVRTTIIPIFSGDKPISTSFLLSYIACGVLLAISAIALYRNVQQNAPLRNGISAKLWTGLIGLLIFFGGYFPGAFAPHPYIGKRLFYFPSVGWALAIGACISLGFYLIRNNKRLILTFTLLFALSVGILFPPQVMRTSEMLLESRNLELLVEKAIDDYGQDADNLFVAGPSLADISTNAKALRLSLPQTTDTLVYIEGNNIHPVGCLDVCDLSSPDEMRTIILDPETEKRLPVFFADIPNAAYSPGTAIGTINNDIQITQFKTLILGNVQAKVGVGLRSQNKLRLHQVYPKVSFLHANGKITATEDVWFVPRPMPDGTVLHRRGAQLTGNSPVVEIKITFYTVPATNKTQNIDNLKPPLKPLQCGFAIPLPKVK